MEDEKATITNERLETLVSCILEPGSHAEGDLSRRGLYPPGTDEGVFPSDVPGKYIGHVAYHLSAMIRYAQELYKFVPPELRD